MVLEIFRAKSCDFVKKRLFLISKQKMNIRISSKKKIDIRMTHLGIYASIEGVI